MTQDWMNDPELDQMNTQGVPEYTEQRALKEFAQRESGASLKVPSRYVTSLSELRQRVDVVAPTHPVVPTQQPVVPTQHPVVPTQPTQHAVTPITLIPTPPPTNSTLRLLSLELKNCVDLVREQNDNTLLIDCADALVKLGVELGIERTMAYIGDFMRDVYTQSIQAPNPHDRFSVLERALDLFSTERKSWIQLTEQINAEGYRNQQGDMWKMHSLRRACERHAERTGRSISRRETK